MRSTELGTRSVLLFVPLAPAYGVVDSLVAVSLIVLLTQMARYVLPLLGHNTQCAQALVVSSHSGAQCCGSSYSESWESL